MRFTEFTKQNISDFEAFTSNGERFLQSKEWGDFQNTLGKQVYRFGVEDKGQIVLTAQGYLSAIGGREYFFVPNGPLTISGEEVSKFFLVELKKRFPKLLFTRIEPEVLSFRSTRLLKTIDLDPHKTLFLDLSTPEEELLASMHHKTRYNIRLAEKKGVRVEVGSDLAKSGELFLDTAKRAGIRAFELDYYAKLLAYFKDGKETRSKLYTAWHENDLLAANLMIYYKDIVIYLFGGSANIKRNLMAPYLLHWQAIKDAKQSRFKVYDFWGIEEDPNHPWYSFSKFKLGFGGRVEHFAGTWDYVYDLPWYNIYKLARKLNRVLKKMQN
jgi:lipid II:glycine glycyltransferase (peptidoglycan interpeptide bridge formation enzyme)